MERCIATSLLRLLFRRVLSVASDPVVNEVFRSCIKNRDNGFVTVSTALEQIAAAFYTKRATSGNINGSYPNNCEDAFRFATNLRLGNVGKYGSRRSVDMNAVGRRVRARVKVIEKFCAAIHGDSVWGQDDGAETFAKMFATHIRSKGASRIKYICILLEHLDVEDVESVFRRSHVLRSTLESSCNEARVLSGSGDGIIGVHSALRMQYLVRKTIYFSFCKQ